MLNKPLKPNLARPKQPLPSGIVDDVLTAVQNSFYSGEDQKWRTQKNDVLRMFVTWPASWLKQRGVTLLPDAYKKILLDLILEIKRHGNTEAIKYWPRYLAHCVQQHFLHHGDEIYEEAKAMRNQLEAALLACTRATEAAHANDPVEALALAHQALRTVNKRKQRPSLTKAQMTLL